jgi:hypothetical protein
MRGKAFFSIGIAVTLCLTGSLWSAAGITTSPGTELERTESSKTTSLQALPGINTPPDVHINTPLIFTLTQGESTYAIPIIERAQSVVAFYNYYSASSHTGFEVAYESKVFLFRNTIDNSLHLVITHDIDNGPSDFNEVYFDLSGVPPGTFVSQSDDPGHCWPGGHPPPCNELDLNLEPEGMWRFFNNTDGGVLSGLPLDVSWCITITPLHWVSINHWIYHFGVGDPIVLDMNEEVTICFTPPEDPDAVHIDEGGQVSLSGFFDDPDALDTHTALWEFGDSNDSLGTFSPGVGFTHHDMDPIVYAYGDNGNLTASLTVTDSSNGVGSADVSVIVANVSPIVIAGGNQTINQGETISISSDFSDPGWLDTHTATINWGDSNTEPGTVVEENDPPNATGTVTGSHFYEDCGVFTIIVTVTDDDGGAGTDSLQVTVIDATPPTITCPPDTTLKADETCEVTYTGPPASAIDNCDPNPDISSSPDLPATFTGVGDYEIIYTAMDESGNRSACTQTITVIDVTPPVLTGVPGDTTVECDGMPPPASPEARDNCDPDPTITYDEIRTDGSCEDQYTLTRTWTARDIYGNSSSQSQEITVQDTQAPVLSGVPSNKTVECDAVPPPASPEARDNCDPNPVITFQEIRIDGPCEDEYTLTRTWTARDRCGNSTSLSQEITVQDTQVPVLSGVPSDETVECDAVPPPASPEASDNCDPNPVITFQETRTDGPCEDTYTLTRTWTARDRCDNNTSQSQTIIVEDTQAPVLSGVPSDETVECDAVPPPASPEARDNCDPNPVITFQETRTDGPCEDTYTLTRTWTARDRCGNSSSATQVIRVEDTTPPAITCPPDTILEANELCQVTYNEPNAWATDNCDSNPAVTSTPTLPVTFTGVGDHEITYTATDRCGNTITCVQTITVIDVIPPVITCPPDTSITNGPGCQVIYEGPSATATDNCDASPDITPLLPFTLTGVGDHTVTWIARDFSGNADTCDQIITILPVYVKFDIKPQSCPNPLNTKSKGVLPVAILGSEDLDVTTIDLESIFLEGVPPIRSSVEDVATPFDGELCDCTTEGADGYDDLTLKFDRQEIVEALGEVSDGDSIKMTITSNLTDGTCLEGSDCVVIRKKGKDSGPQSGSSSSLPTVYALHQNQPNPFGQLTAISYQLKAPGYTSLKIYDLTGRLVRTLVNEEKEAGYYSINWDKRNDLGRELSSGIYFYRIVSSNYKETKKMILLR